MAERVPTWRWAERWYYVVASHRPSQLGWRALRILQRRLRVLRPVPAPVASDAEFAPRPDSGLEQILQRHLSLRAARGSLTDRAHSLLGGEFCFLNESRQLGPFGDPLPESVAPMSRLWRFHLQYQEYLLDLVAAGRLCDVADAQQRVWPIVEAWIRRHRPDPSQSGDDAWHPFCLSRRIAVWLLLWQAEVIPPEQRGPFVRCLEEQTRSLEQHLEWDLRGNHLLENLRTLILAGAAWQGEMSDRRLDRAIRLCRTQIDEQILPSGEHFERSPMYHAQMLSALLDIRDATRDLRPDFSQVCRETASRMAGFLGGILHPDGQVPLLSDSTLEETPCPAILVLHADPPDDIPAFATTDAGTSREITGYWTWRSDNDALLFDHGPVGADELPAHAHADLLTIEASLGGRRWIVDSGVFDYDQSPLRRYCRSTSAHNVLQVDGAEQCDLWSRFRMGRRGRPINFSSGTGGGFFWGAATHNAYANLGVPRLGRWVACRSRGPWIVADWAEGSGEHRLDDWIHLAPHVAVRRQDTRSVELRSNETTAWLRFHTPGELSIESGWYCPDFGVQREAPVIRFHHTAALPCMIVWTLEWGDAGDGLEVRVSEPQQTVLIGHSGGEPVRWDPRLLV